MRLQGKRAVITGAANGIGRAIALRFASEGAVLTLVDLEQAAGEQLANDIGERAEFVRADVTNEAEVADTIARARATMGGIDTLLNAAGLSQSEDLLGIDLESWNADLAVNLSSHFLCTKAAVPIMTEGGGGTVISMSSVNGVWAIGETGYSAAKAGLISFIQNVAVRYGEDGIRANVIVPGTILSEHCQEYWNSKAGAVEKLKKWYPIGRLGTPEDVANLAVFLASRACSKT
ncbi:MAG: SDR family NAD(P)-dependent oxidoreductase [Limisphaerales bacterium]